MMEYRIREIDPGCWAPAVRRSWRMWSNLTDQGTELPWGTRWSGPLDMATAAIEAHQRAAGWTSTDPKIIHQLGTSMLPVEEQQALDEMRLECREGNGHFMSLTKRDGRIILGLITRLRR